MKGVAYLRHPFLVRPAGRTKKSGSFQNRSLMKIVARILLADYCGDDLLLVDWAVTRSFFNRFQFLDHIHTVGDFAENGVIHVQPWSGGGGDKELAAIRPGSSVGHGE